MLFPLSFLLCVSMLLLLLLQRLFLEMILLLFLPLYMDLFNLMDNNFSICLNTWLMLFEICHLYLWLQVEVGVGVMYLLYLPLHQEVEAMVINLFNLMDISISICLNPWLMLFKICNLNLLLRSTTTFLKTSLKLMVPYHLFSQFKEGFLYTLHRSLLLHPSHFL
jgi:hypothetical protein